MDITPITDNTAILKGLIVETLDEVFGDKIEQVCNTAISKLKDTLMLQLVGFIMEEKRQMEERIGSGNVQKIWEEPGVDEKETPADDTNTRELIENE
jgi:hypothetical protein